MLCGRKLHIPPIYQLSSPSCSTKAIQKSLTLTENVSEFSGEIKENRPLTKKMAPQKEQEHYIGRKTREKTGKGMQISDSPEIPDRWGNSDGQERLTLLE